MDNAFGTHLIAAFAVGVGATAVMDLWAEFQKRVFGVPSLDYAVVGRWLGNFGGRHESVSSLRPVRGERILGWGAHYAIGIAFAMVLIMLWGEQWLINPELVPALIVGIGSIVMPLFVMQPSLGMGIAAAKTPRPWISRARSLSAHAAFAIGIYFSGLIVSIML